MKSDTEDRVRLQQELNVFRRLAFFGTVVSTVSTLVAVVVVPMTYNYMQHVHNSLMTETDFCRHRLDDLIQQFVRLEESLMSPLSISSSAIVNRGKRQTQAVVEWQRTNSRDGFLRRSSGLIGKQQVRIRGTIPAQRNDIQQPQQPNQGKISILQQKQQPPPPVFQESYQALPIAADQCCSCGSGRPGPPGFPGTDGYPGRDGDSGQPGHPGEDAPKDAKIPIKEFCFECPSGPQGPAGLSGVPGPPGLNGPPGIPGSTPEPGVPGLIGIQGALGQHGAPGDQGPQGPPGLVIEVEGALGATGLPGLPGMVGPKGLPGAPGLPGSPGPIGPPGDEGSCGNDGVDGAPGWQGPSGTPGSIGSCDHCPPPRTAPGY